MKALISTALLLSIAVTAQNKKVNRPDELVLRPTRTTVVPSGKLSPVLLPNGRMLIAIDDTVYMLDDKGNVSWKYVTDSGNEILEQPAFNPESNEIGLVGGDLFFARLDAETGKAKAKPQTNGRASYVEIKAYRKGFLIVLDMSGYRDNYVRSADKLEYWEGPNDPSWAIDFPQGADLVVSGTRIYALRNIRRQIRLRELHLPEKAEESPR